LQYPDRFRPDPKEPSSGDAIDERFLREPDVEISPISTKNSHIAAGVIILRANQWWHVRFAAKNRALPQMV
jgi:hypothetical protein